ncbi:MAG: hypothetical protein EOM52_00600 [Clostridia bacterium]|nr:hypothetical protein [Clostridia bacterium]
MKRKLFALTLTLALALNVSCLLPSAAAEDGGRRYSNQAEDGAIPYGYDMEAHAYMTAAESIGDMAEDAENAAAEDLSSDMEPKAAAEAEAIALREGDTICIGGKEELVWFSDYVNHGGATQSVIWELRSDIGGFAAPEDFSPIGTEEHVFQGVFDGGGFTVAFTLSKTGLTYVGLFGVIEDAVIKNLSVENPIFSISGSSAGGIAGSAKNSTFENCAVRSSISLNITTGNVGGIAGSAEDCKILGCTVEGSISSVAATSGYTGGIVGWAKNTVMESCSSGAGISGGSDAGGIAGNVNGGSMTDCVNTGTVQGGANSGGIAGALNSVAVSRCANQGEISGKTFGGGIAGNISGGTVSQSFNTGGIKASGSPGNMIGGGIAAQLASGTVEQCFNSGTIAANSAGGIVGSTVGNGNDIADCYHTGKVDAGAGGGIVAILSSGSGTVEGCYTAGQTGKTSGYPIAPPSYTVNNCYFDSNIFAGSTSSGSGKTTSELVSGKSTAVSGLDQEIWAFPIGSYPQLKCMEGKSAAEKAVAPRTPYILAPDFLYSGSPAVCGADRKKADVYYYIPDTGYAFVSCALEIKQGEGWTATVDATEPGDYRATLTYESAGKSRTQTCTFQIMEPDVVEMDGEGEFTPARSGVYMLPEGDGETWKVAGDDTAYEGGIPVYLKTGETYRFTKSS